MIGVEQAHGQSDLAADVGTVFSRAHESGALISTSSRQGSESSARKRAGNRSGKRPDGEVLHRRFGTVYGIGVIRKLIWRLEAGLEIENGIKGRPPTFLNNDPHISAKLDDVWPVSLAYQTKRITTA